MIAVEESLKVEAMGNTSMTEVSDKAMNNTDPAVKGLKWALLLTGLKMLDCTQH